jgi:hypothetical protein
LELPCVGGEARFDELAPYRIGQPAETREVAPESDPQDLPLAVAERPTTRQPQPQTRTNIVANRSSISTRGTATTNRASTNRSTITNRGTTTV